MTPKIKNSIQDWKSECEVQIIDYRYDLVDRNVAQHQFFGYLVALEQMGFITEDELKENAADFWISREIKMAVVANARSKRVERHMAAMRKSIQTYGIPESIYVDNGREYLTFEGASLGKSEACAAIREPRVRRKVVK